MKTKTIYSILQYIFSKKVNETTHLAAATLNFIPEQWMEQECRIGGGGVGLLLHLLGTGIINVIIPHIFLYKNFS